MEILVSDPILYENIGDTNPRNHLSELVVNTSMIIRNQLCSSSMLFDISLTDVPRDYPNDECFTADGWPHTRYAYLTELSVRDYPIECYVIVDQRIMPGARAVRANRTAVLEDEQLWLPPRNWESLDDETGRCRRYVIPETGVEVTLTQMLADDDNPFARDLAREKTPTWTVSHLNPNGPTVVDRQTFPPGYHARALIERGCHPGEALDWLICELDGTSQTDWAAIRARNQSTISRNVKRARFDRLGGHP